MSLHRKLRPEDARASLDNQLVDHFAAKTVEAKRRTEGNQNVFLTAVVAMVLGIVIGMVGLVAIRNAVDPSAAEVCAAQGTC